ncbi:hypothetical protein [Spirosoma gilvum]
MVANEKVSLAKMDEELKQAEAVFAETLAYLQKNGIKLPDSLIDTSDWLTIKRYAEKYNVSTNVVSNWVARGIIPADCMRVVPELNDLRLIKDRAYK